MIERMTGLKENLFIKEILKIKIIFFILFFIFSCQPVEVLDEVIFEYNQLPKISINAKEKLINEVYEINYVDPYIDHSIKHTPLSRIKNWLDQNINIFGTQNKLTINIIDASLTRIERKNDSKKKYEENTEFFYEMHYMLEFLLLDDNDLILATTVVEAKHSTTSGKFISLNEKENIVDTLILDTLIDVSLKSEELLKKHMFDFVL